METKLLISDYSFLESQELLKDCKTSLSDEIIEERRNAINPFITADKLLSDEAIKEGLTTKI